jgi:hypothetical protein
MQEQAALAVKRSYSYAQTNEAPDAGDEMGGDLEIGIIARRILPQQTFLRLMRSSNNAGYYVASLPTVTTTKLENWITKILD